MYILVAIEVRRPDPLAQDLSYLRFPFLLYFYQIDFSAPQPKSKPYKIVME